MRDPGKIRYMQGCPMVAMEQISCSAEKIILSDFLVLTHSQEGQPSYYMKLINIHGIEVSISAWVSHSMPF